ncbi:adenosylcobinamide amidohydrolase [uncultured Sulfitobacter sp.]|uniref:adenosylcobinamide amidohydrolase n=1 Tax=uncultured Sulfitobacter sp. TaxID=191468 RepID=UPI00261E38CB|nr:adenosylcobinamide amidohydrolase [uncultured Sulfitobacter sp.]
MTARVTLERPWLIFDLGREMRVLSWAINKPGFVMADRILWREVRNADLPRDMDVHRWLKDTLAERGQSDAVCFLTSRDVGFYTEATATVEGVVAHCVATVGLSNAERIGHRVDRSQMDWGTINIAVSLQSGLSQTGLIEALTIVAQARTAAIMDVGLALPTGSATGTGTDCIAVASPIGTSDYAGLHTAIGEAIGEAVYNATLGGAQEWMQTVKPAMNL